MMDLEPGMYLVLELKVFVSISKGLTRRSLRSLPGSAFSHHLEFKLILKLLEKEMATHSSTLARKTPWTEETGRLQNMGHKESDRTEHAHAEAQSSKTLSFCLRKKSDTTWNKVRSTVLFSFSKLSSFKKLIYYSR